MCRCQKERPLFTIEGITARLDLKNSLSAQLTVEAVGWRMIAENTVGFPHLNLPRMNLRAVSLYHVCRDPVAPHGILGQTFDCDGTAVDGREDSYSILDDKRPTVNRRDGGTVTTRAQAEGAIEGSAGDYRMRWPFSSEFAFSRFGATGHVAPRNASALGGARRKVRLTLKSLSKVLK